MISRNKKRPSKTSKPRPTGMAIDPTRTTGLRLQAVRAIRRKFARLKGLLVQLVMGEDAFGLKVRENPLGLSRNAFCPTGPGGGVDPSCSPSQNPGSFAEYTKALQSGLPESVSYEDFHVSRVISFMSDARGGFAVPIDEFKARLGDDFKEGIDERLVRMRWEGQIRLIAIGDPQGWDAPGRWEATIKGEGETFGYIEPVRNVENDLDLQQALKTLRGFPKAQFVENAFCPTGPGGGIDPTCSSGGNLQVGDKFEDEATGKRYQILKLVDVFGIPSADVVKLRDDGAPSTRVRKGLRAKNLPVSKFWKKIPPVSNYDQEKIPWMFPVESDSESKGHLDRPKTTYGQPSGRYTHGSLSSQENYGGISTSSRDSNRAGSSNILTNRFQFLTNPDKIAEFQKWLRQQFKATLLGKSDEELWAEFAQKGYEKGAGRAFDDVNKKTRWRPGEGDFYGRSKQEFLRSSFGQAESTDKLRLLAGRSFTDLVNVTDDMAARMSRTLMDGLARGANPSELVGQLTEDLDVSEARAETIARTEIIRAHAEGQLDAMEKLGVEEVGVAVEWSTAGDLRVCPQCRPLEGVVLTIQEAHGLIPAHPNCRCSFIPANVGEDVSKQKRSKKEILDAFDESGFDPPELDEQRPEPLVEALTPTKNAEFEFTTLESLEKFWKENV